MAGNSNRGFKIAAYKVRRKLTRMPDEITRGVKSEIQTQADALHKTMQALAPISNEAMPQDWKGRRRKHLRAALEAKVSKNGLTARVGIIGKKKNETFFFAKFLEFGTKHIPKGLYSFILPAYRSRRERIRRRIKDEVRLAFRRAARDV